jgi:adenylylsulfate kinase-like enzyme
MVKPGQVLWVTGLSGAGKTSLAAELVSRLREQRKPVVFLDGDELRDVFGLVGEPSAQHARQSRLALAMRYSRLCRVLASQGLIVVIATISMFREVHAFNRAVLPGYFEVYLKVPEEELRRRDPKGIYRRFDVGEIRDVAGVDLAVDEPEAADWVAEFVPEIGVPELADAVLRSLTEKGA